MSKVKIYHNPRCSKSRMALDYLKNQNQDVEIIEYLKEIPTKKELVEIIQMLNIPAESLIRKGESIYKEEFKGRHLTDDEWVDAMIEFPKLIERPIVIKNKIAVIARPTERLEELM